MLGSLTLSDSEGLEFVESASKTVTKVPVKNVKSATWKRGTRGFEIVFDTDVEVGKRKEMFVKVDGFEGE
ncbi:hypothetical protein HDU76_004927, partial [Blyttiomyces sp. JEL0837]